MNLKQMSFKKVLIASVSLLSIALVFGAVFGLAGIKDIGQVITKVEKEESRNSISGRIGSDGPILVVKIDDTFAAHPQAGLEDADVVYIEQVEGGLTRLAAVFSSKIPDVIGPVRSARISDIELLEQFGRVAFAYSGAQSKLLPVIAEANLENLGAQRQGRDIYANDLARVAPTAMMLQAKTLMGKVATQASVIAISKNIPITAFGGRLCNWEWPFRISPKRDRARSIPVPSSEIPHQSPPHLLGHRGCPSQN